jgi:hypothetical protein
VLPGPALIHLPGRRMPPLFVSVLLHFTQLRSRRLQQARGQSLILRQHHSPHSCTGEPERWLSR